METSLHRALKERYAAGLADRREVRIEGFRIDAVDQTGRFVEIQSGALGPLRRKVRIFPHANLDIEVLGVTIDELRIRRRRRPGYSVTDRRLGEIRETATLAKAGDLWGLLPPECQNRAPFTTVDLSTWLGRPVWFAQRVAYCLRKTGAARMMGKKGNRLIYVRD
jgi:hypothetical protein